ncbi:MAG: SDR family NAD(P)-dependent oxidoreductase [Pseudomonadota bacterium]
MSGPVAVVLGVGPLDGLGAELCMRFAAAGLDVTVAGRSADKLEAVVAAITAQGGRARAAVADATSETQVNALFDEAPGPVDLAIYNAGNNVPGRIIDMDLATFSHAMAMGPTGGFLFGRAAVRHMVPQRTGTLLFTGASASLRGRARFGAFNASKGALRNLAQAMAKEYAEEGIHVGHVIIDGPIGGEKIKQGFPEYAAKLGEAGMISLEGIVDAFEYLYRQQPRAWSFEVDVRTSAERW